MNIALDAKKLLKQLGVDAASYAGKDITVRSPIDGSVLAALRFDNASSLDKKITAAEKAFLAWRDVPAPKRGELVRLFGEELRTSKEPLATLVTMECGKILEEGRGEVQEMIDICDFAVGLSRQLYGLTIASERAHHVMQENWLPLGVVGIISAFNFPVAVWAWNAALALVCGDSTLWKPSEKTPLCALACQAIFERAVARYNKQGGSAPPNLSAVILADAALGAKLVSDKRIPLISATGSTRMGSAVAPVVAKRFGRSLLELGGNNAVIVTASADLDVALPSILFGAVGTAGQRCTSTRRVLVHSSLYDSLTKKLEKAFAHLAKQKIGNPLEKHTIIGPLIDKISFTQFEAALTQAKKEGGIISGGKRALSKIFPEAYYVEPALVKIKKQTAVVKKETFAPIVYVIPYSTLEQAVAMNNDVPQGLSSAIFTTDIREAEYFKQHSDCGIANVNIGTSGAEIGGAFGGEKETGGGRESGSDSWKIYMRRQTSTTYYAHTKPELAQGVRFDAE